MYLAPYVTRYMLLLLPLPFAFAFTLQLAPYPQLVPYPHKMLSIFLLHTNHSNGLINVSTSLMISSILLYCLYYKATLYHTVPCDLYPSLDHM